MEVDMSKYIEFGKDVGLMAEAVRRGLSVGIGHWEFWEWLSRPQPGLWSEMRQFMRFATPEYVGQWTEWQKDTSEVIFRLSDKLHHRPPDIDTLDAVVRQSRENDFGAKEWQRLVESSELFRTLVAYLRIEAPFSIQVEVNYDDLPPYRHGFNPGFLSVDKSGRYRRREAGLYITTQDTDINNLSLYLNDRGWRFGDQHELYSFGQATKQQVRPWSIFGDVSIYALASRKSDRDGWCQFPRLWTLCGNDELDHSGSCVDQGKSLHAGNHLLVVKL